MRTAAPLEKGPGAPRGSRRRGRCLPSWAESTTVSRLAVAPLLSIAAVDIGVDGRPIDATLPASWIEAALADAHLTVGAGDWEATSRPEGGSIAGRLSRSGKEHIVVRARVTAELTLACSRCLAPTVIEVDAELSLLLQPASRGAERQSQAGLDQQPRGGSGGGEHEFSATEADMDVYDGETVVLDEFVREAILLELPQFPLCSGSCVGIPPASATGAGARAATSDQAIDPRLAPLGVLRSKLTGEPIPAELDPASASSAAPRAKPMLRSTTRRGLSKRKRKKKRR